MMRQKPDWPYTIPEDTGWPVARTYALKHSTLVRLVTMAKKLGCYPSHLVEAFLLNGLDGIESGSLVIEKKPVVFNIEVKKGSPP